MIEIAGGILLAVGALFVLANLGELLKFLFFVVLPLGLGVILIAWVMG